MKKSLSRILSLTLILAMLISVVPFTFAETRDAAAPDDTTTDPISDPPTPEISVTAGVTATPATAYPGTEVALTATGSATGTGNTTVLSSEAKIDGASTYTVTEEDAKAGKAEIQCNVVVSYTYTITTTGEDGKEIVSEVLSGSQTVQCTATVDVKTAEYTLTLSPATITAYPGQTVALPTATVVGSDGKPIEGVTVTWDGVSGSTYKAEASGSLTAKAVIDGEEVSANCEINVVEPKISCASTSVLLRSAATLTPKLDTVYTTAPKVEYTYTVDGVTQSGASFTSSTVKVMTVTITASLDGGVATATTTAQISFYADQEIEVTMQDGLSSFEFGESKALTEGVALSSQMVQSATGVPTILSGVNVYFDTLGSTKTSAVLTLPAGTGANNKYVPISWLTDVKLTVNSNGGDYFTFSYTIKDSALTYGTGTVRVNFSGSGDIVYKTDSKTSVTFDEDDFEDFWDNSNSVTGSLKYVVFGVTTRIPSFGDLYTTAAETKAVTSSMKFQPYYTNSSSYYDLDTVTYAPDSKYTDAYTVEIPFVAYGGTNNQYLAGTVVIELNGGSGDISYETDYKTAITFDEDDFEKFWDKSSSVSGSLGYVVFNTLPRYGTLYTTSTKTTKATTSMRFQSGYANSSSYYDLDKVYYVPSSSNTSAYTVEIPFTAYGGSNNTQKLSGTVVISLNGTGTGISSTGVIFGAGKNTIADQMAEDYENATDAELAYVIFDLPDVEDGRLYYDYTTILDTDYVTAKTEYYVKPGSKQLGLDDVAFVPAAGRSGNVTITYTGYDKNGKNAKEMKLVLNVVTKTKSSEFSDVTTSYSWAADSIDFLSYQGVVQGSNGKYNPSASITRGDFMIMLYRAFLEGEYGDYKVTSNFADVTKGTSSYSQETYQAVGVAKYLGIAQGDGTNFKPTTSITREEAMTLIYRTLDKIDVGLEYSTTTKASSFSDYSSVSSYAQSAITYLVQHGIVVGSNGKITPKSNITRAEMAVILHRVLTY